MNIYRTGFIVSLLLMSQFSRAQDWAGLNRFRDSNTVVNSLPNHGDRVVFMGNSITDSWITSDPEYFSKNHYIDRGYSGQTSPQMLLRFRADVISLKPVAVVLLCGINDLAGNTGPSTLEMIEDNIQSMAELAGVNKIKIILCSVLPAYDFPWKPNTFPAEKIIALNSWIKEYAEKNKLAYIDYYPAFVDERKGMKKEFSEDGVHPNKDGYAVMERIAQPVILKVLKRKSHAEKTSLF